VLDPVTIGLAIKAMQGAYNGIQYCVEALADGKVQVQKIKKAAEDAQTIVKDVKSIWSILAGLFSGKPREAAKTDTPQPAPEPVAQKKAAPKEVYIRHIPTEAEIVQKFVDHVGDFYEHHIKLSEIYDTKSEEVYAMDRPNPRDILILSQIKHELDGSFGKLSSMMRGASVPPQLGPLWDNFHEIYDRVTEQQQARRERERIRRQNESWQQDYRRKISNAKMGYAVVLLVVGLWMTVLFLAL
jgi:hypothetical protein